MRWVSAWSATRTSGTRANLADAHARRLGGLGAVHTRGVGPGIRYKFLVTRGDGMRIFKADPLARASDHPPGDGQRGRVEPASLARRSMDAAARQGIRVQRPLSRCTRSTSPPGGEVRTGASSTTARSPSRSRTIAWRWGSPTLSCSDHGAPLRPDRGATRSPATTPRRRGTALPTTSATSSMSCTARASG